MSLVLPIDSSDPHYVVVVALEGTRYRISMNWNERAGYWHMSIAQEDETRIVDGLRAVADWPMLRKVADTAAPPGDIVFVDTSGDGAPPGRDDLGQRVEAIYFLESELSA